MEKRENMTSLKNEKKRLAMQKIVFCGKIFPKENERKREENNRTIIHSAGRADGKREKDREQQKDFHIFFIRIAYDRNRQKAEGFGGITDGKVKNSGR